jgi:hypothetical protein
LAGLCAGPESLGIAVIGSVPWLQIGRAASEVFPFGQSYVIVTAP